MNKKNKLFTILCAGLLLSPNLAVIAAEATSTATFTATYVQPTPVPVPVPTPTPPGTPVGQIIGITAGGILGGFAFIPTLSRFLPSTIATRTYPCPVYTNSFFNQMYGYQQSGNQMAMSVAPMRIAVINEDPKLQIKPELIQKALANNEKQPNIMLYEVKVNANPQIKGNTTNMVYLNPELIKTTYNDKTDLAGNYRGELLHTAFGRL